MDCLYVENQSETVMGLEGVLISSKQCSRVSHFPLNKAILCRSAEAPNTVTIVTKRGLAILPQTANHGLRLAVSR